MTITDTPWMYCIQDGSSECHRVSIEMENNVETSQLINIEESWIHWYENIRVANEWLMIIIIIDNDISKNWRTQNDFNNLNYFFLYLELLTLELHFPGVRTSTLFSVCSAYVSNGNLNEFIICSRNDVWRSTLHVVSGELIN